VTVSSLVAQYSINELPFHLKFALENGVTREELIEAITHLAFYSGWPTASTAVGMRDVSSPNKESENGTCDHEAVAGKSQPNGRARRGPGRLPR
jgi:4-carboxymuconolactone decarboxylase